MTTIVLADDHHLVRQGLRLLLETEADFEIVGEAGDGLEAVQLIERVQPEIAVIDLMMPNLSGLETARQVSQLSPATRVIVLSMYANKAYVLEALRNGASGYVLKKSTADELVRAIREVAAGRRYLSAPFSEEAIELYLRKADESKTEPADLLTSRQREVLHLIVDGHTNAEIAALLFISPRTVEKHRAELMNKLGAHSQAELIRYALQRGILPPEQM